MSVNKAIIMGRLGQDPAISYTNSGMAVCKFSLATSRKQKDGKEITQWHRLTAFDKAAELIAKYVAKGNMLYIEGEINYGQYEKDGITRYTTDIIVREFNFIGSGDGAQNTQKQGQNQGHDRYQNGAQNNQQSQNSGYQNDGNSGGAGSIPDDDLPF